MNETLYKGGRISVTTTALKTPRQTFALDKIEHVSVRKPFLIIAGLISFGFIGICISFWRYLYTIEIVILCSLSALFLIISTRLGILKLQSFVLNESDNRVFGNVYHLNAAKNAIEIAMEKRLKAL